MGKKVVVFGLVLLCSLVFLVSPVEAGYEVWLLRQRVRWTSNDGTRSATQTSEGELRVTVSGGKALDLNLVGGWGWLGDFVAADQVWRDTTIKRHYAIFEGFTFWGVGFSGWLRPNRSWTRITGKFSGTAWDTLEPAWSSYFEGTLTATYSHWVP